MATLLPNGRQQIFDTNGAPLVSGVMYMYVPNAGTTLKDTWQDAGQVVLNTNPIILDDLGSAVIYGAGTYHQVVYDSAGNLIWDALTASTDVGGLSWGGVSAGTANVQTATFSGFNEQDGQQLAFIAGLTNTSALTMNGIAVLKDTLSGPVPLTGGEVTQNNAVMMLYEQSRGAFHLVEYPITPGTGILTNLAGGTTIDLGTIASQNVNVTGSAWTATSFGSSASANSPIFYLTFAGTGTLTNNGTSLILPGGLNITVAAGDTAIAMYLGSGNWRVMMYQHASNFQAGYRYIGTQSFTGSGTYTPTAGTRYIKARLWGGGGGGGGVVSGGTDAVAGGGGGGGAYTEYNAAVPTAQTVTIGAAGAAGANTGTSGGTGGATSLGALATAPGGLGGAGANASAAGAVTALAGGAGGAPGTGTVSFAGPPGGGGLGVDNNAAGYGSVGGAGGGPAGGIGAIQNGSATSAAGSAGRAFGSGGGGAASADSGGGVAGGVGSAGLLIVDEFG